jgi:hypothetical protein
MRFDAPFAVRRMLMLNYTTFLLQQGGGGRATGEINIMYLRSKEMKSALRPKNERALPEGVKEPLPATSLSFSVYVGRLGISRRKPC